MTNLNRPLIADLPGFKPSQVWVLLWSKRQGMIHIETLHEMFLNHAADFQEDRDSEYIPLLIGDREAIDAAAEGIRPTVHARYDAKQAASLSAIPYSQLP